jgi:OPA family glycerol-3-phosphate transporter-like MFS transporter 3
MQVALSPSNHTEYPDLHPTLIWDSEQFFPSPDEAGLLFGYIDSTLLFCYAIGLFLSGWIADRVNQRYLLSGGMVLSAVFTFLFGSVGPWLRIHSIYYYVIIWGINGFIQSSGWPAVIAVMGNWFGKSSRGFIFGLWSANPSVGNIFSALLISSLLPYGFELAMMACSFLMFTGGIIVFFCLPEHPDTVGMSTYILFKNSITSSRR